MLDTSRYRDTTGTQAKHSLVKLAVVGKENVGKTVLVHRLMRRDEEPQGYLQVKTVDEGCTTRPLGASTWAALMQQSEGSWYL
jgi:GTPase SAR1 family protein